MSYTSGFVFGDSGASSSSNCLKAVEPVVYQEPSLTVLAGTGATLANLFTLPTASSLAGYSGQVDNRGNCFNLLLTITYLTGADCDGCTDRPLTAVTKTVFVKKGDVFNIPAGYWNLVQYQVVDDDLTPINATKDGIVRFYSSHTPACPGCTPLGNDVIEPAAALRTSSGGTKSESAKV